LRILHFRRYVFLVKRRAWSNESQVWRLLRFDSAGIDVEGQILYALKLYSCYMIETEET